MGMEKGRRQGLGKDRREGNRGERDRGRRQGTGVRRRME